MSPRDWVFVLKPITWYADSRTTHSIPSLYWHSSLNKFLNNQHLLLSPILLYTQYILRCQYASSDLKALMHLNLPDFSTLTLKYPLARFFFTTHTNSYDLWRSTGHKSQLTFSCFRPILLPSMTLVMEYQYWVYRIRMFFAKNWPVLKEIFHIF